MLSKTPLTDSPTEFKDFPNLDFVTPLFQAHAHNDYEHPEPLFDALINGFTSIEVDIHLINDELYVNHLRPIFPNKERTLTKLYLEPLFEGYLQSNGRFFPTSDRPLQLMIDIKTNKNRTYTKLKEVLKPYEEMFTYWEENIEHPSAVSVILSGHRPIEKVLEEKKRFVQIDGRIRDIGKNYAPEFMPMISDKFSRVCGWSIFSKKPSIEKLEKMNQFAQKIHAEGKKFRLWKSPEDTFVWETMLNQGVDIINTDSLNLLSNFLLEKMPKTPLANSPANSATKK